MELQFTPDLQPHAQVQQHVRPPEGMAPWPLIPVRCVSYEHNCICSQRIEGSYYRLIRFHIMLKQAVHLVPRVRQRTLAFSFLHRGNIRGRLRGVKGPLHFREGHCYIPLLLPDAGLESLLELDAGNYEATVILLEKDREELILDMFPGLREDRRHVHTYSGKGLPYPPFPISPRISNLLTPLTQFCEPPRHLTWVADQCVAGLIKTLDDVRREMELLPDLPYRLHTYLCNHLEENLTIDSVAHALSMNRKQLRQVAKQQFGRTFKDYLTHLRIERAKALLADASVQIQQIALDLGYNSKAHFSQAFRKQTGRTPSDYRMAVTKKRF